MKTMKASGKKKRRRQSGKAKASWMKSTVQNGASLSKHMKSQESLPSASLEGAGSVGHPSKADFLCKIRKQKGV